MIDGCVGDESSVFTRMMKSISQYLKSDDSSMFTNSRSEEIKCQDCLTRFSLRVKGQANFDLTIYLLKQKNERK